MADNTFSLSGAASIGGVLETSGLNLALTTASLDIRLLVSEQVKLRETLTLLNVALSQQQSLLKANGSAAASSSEPKSVKGRG